MFNTRIRFINIIKILKQSIVYHINQTFIISLESCSVSLFSQLFQQITQLIARKIKLNTYT